MRIVALGQQKGGCGKSAVAINLACQAVAHGKKAALIDMDSEQGTARRWGARRGEMKEGAPLVRSADAVSLTKTLSDLKAQGYEWAFLDLPGRSAPIAGSGMVAADMILIPARPSDVDIEASIATVRTAKRANKKYAYLMNIVPPQHQQRRAKEAHGMLEVLGHPVCPVYIVYRLMVSDAIAEGKGMNEEKPNESAAEFSDLFEWLEKQVSK